MATKAYKPNPKFMQYSKKMATAVTIFWMLYRLANFAVAIIHPNVAKYLVDLSTGVDTRDVADAQYGTGRVIDGIGVFQIMLVRLIMSTTAVIVIDQVTGNGIDQGWQGDVGHHLVRGQKTEEHVLHKILRFDRITETTADIRQQFAPVSNVIIG